MADATDTLLDATTALVLPLLRTLAFLRTAGRHLHPPEISVVAAAAEPLRAPLLGGLDAFAAVSWPTHLEDFRRSLDTAAGRAREALERLHGAPAQPQPVLAAYRALGRASDALDALYPVAAMLPPVSRFFLGTAQQQDERLLDLLAAGNRSGELGVHHVDNALGQRGGCSLYLPEALALGEAEPARHYGRARPPLVVALHGGSGHGRRFLWSWLRDARSGGALLLAPTSGGETWSLADPAADAVRLAQLVRSVCDQWPVDSRRILLTGMSDGATFSYLAGLAEDAPYTHLAPVSGTFHPLLLEGCDAARLQNLPVFLVHGALDWMFPVEVAQTARSALDRAGAAVRYEELADLSHTYPEEVNARILDWLFEGSG